MNLVFSDINSGNQAKNREKNLHFLIQRVIGLLKYSSIKGHKISKYFDSKIKINKKYSTQLYTERDFYMVSGPM